MISIKTPKEIEAMREGGKILAEIMEKLGEAVVPGKNTLEIDKLAEELVFLSDGIPVFKGFGKESGKPFPGTICASLNDEIVHGIPREDRILRDGNLLKIDIGMRYKGMVTDMARTFPVGKVSRQAQKILDVTRQALDLGIEELKPGQKIRNFSGVVQRFIEANGFSVVRNLVGHGVGRKLHEDPVIFNHTYNIGQDGEWILKEGMTLALEPMANEGSPREILGEDGWAYKTTDGKLSAHFEDTVVITKDGAEILTRI